MRSIDGKGRSDMTGRKGSKEGEECRKGRGVSVEGGVGVEVKKEAQQARSQTLWGRVSDVPPPDQAPTPTDLPFPKDLR